jgi:hypothetical protein
MGVFEKLLGLGSLESLEAFLLCQLVAIPIFNDNIRLISLEVIVPTIYLSYWAIIALITIFRLLLDLRSFFFEAIGVSSLGSFLFQAHLRLK